MAAAAMSFTAVPLTLYPDMFPGPLGHSRAGRALESGLWSCAPVQIRDFAADRHRTVDDTPAGGGAGMVLKADVLGRAIDHAAAAHPRSEEHTSELQSLMRISYAVFCLKKKKNTNNQT